MLHSCAGIHHVDLKANLMAQPPHDAQMSLPASGPFYLLHYTYGTDFAADGRRAEGGDGTCFNTV